MPCLSELAVRCKVKKTTLVNIRNNYVEWNKRACWYDLFFKINRSAATFIFFSEYSFIKDFRVLKTI